MADVGDIAIERRFVLMGALDEAERIIEEPVLAHYDDMLAVNAALTAHLSAAADVTETHDQILAALSIDPKKLLPLDAVNEQLERIIGLGASTATGESVRSDVDDILNSIRETLKGGRWDASVKFWKIPPTRRTASFHRKFQASRD
ncbi:MAG: hypothetical protein IPP40_09145 [bacterium]|nr:hypothetical protein [bacterium]